MRIAHGIMIPVVGILTGVINGLLGIGGGTILIPAMVALMGVSQHKAHGTSLAIILPTALVSSFVYRINGSMDIYLALQVAIGGMIGGYLGARLMNYIPAASLKKIFGAFILAAGIRMVM
ncbi:hypothetical protein Tfer_0287 [Thermincola ferriacetica]|uniref:Probable membrane transporter protein n=2 Tax=Thermincola TaxID=278993 RepID=D5XEW8_THEPJ|nr:MULTISPECIES: sulfite exporter TauE/SafE family protein [Thermincola]ADG82189.1 protein of unknown function DUF81 [Thermincola potens JR]KNZ71208.1 hypothetical protein Tfer_0287 [Thermincola ferriacetica]